MSSIINYKYQQQQQISKQYRSSLYKQCVRVQRKQLNKKLKAIQNRPDKWVHEMDNEMLKTICQMLYSKTEADIEMARDIIFNSKMSLFQISILTLDEYMCNLILNGPSYLNMWTYNQDNISNYFTTI
jgi:hypothetical protein